MEHLDVDEFPTYETNVSNSTNSSYVSNSSANEYYLLGEIVIYANKYLLPIIICTGFIGNTISCAVFLRTKLKRISTSVYLAALSISDTGFLLCLGFGWLHVMGVDLFHTEVICQIVVYMTFVFSFTSVWYVNAFTFEMYVAVFHHTRAPTLCTPRFAKKFVIGMTVFACLFYSFSLSTAKVTVVGTEKKCMPTPNDQVPMMVLSFLDTFMTLLIPFTMIIFMTTRLLFDISRVYRSNDRRSQDNTDVTSESGIDRPLDSHEDPDEAVERGQRQALKAQAKLTRMLVVVVLVFLVLNLPSHAIRVQSFFRSITESAYITTRTEFYSQHLVQLLYYFNFAVNFVLYSVCAKSFRAALTTLCRDSCRNRNPDIASCYRRLVSVFGFKPTVTEVTGHNGYDESMNNGNSRLVEIHLSEIHFSQIPSFDSQYVCESPPCLLGVAPRDSRESSRTH